VKPDTRLLPVLVHPRRLLAAAALALLALALGAGPALAATPIDLGAADKAPHLALDAAGSAHLTWASPAPPLGNTPLNYCRIDRGGSGCASFHTFPQIGTFTADFGNAPLLVAGGAVDVLDARFNGTEQKHLWTSANAFASPSVVATNAVTAGTMEFTQALYAQKGSVSSTGDVIATILGGSHSGGAIVQATGLSGTTEGSAKLSPSGTADATLGRYGPSLIAVYIDLGSGRPISWRRYTGSGTPTSINTASNWTAAAPIAAGDNEVALAEGVDGLYLAYQGPSDELLLAHYNGISGFEPAVTVVGPHATEISAFEDGAGIVHLVWLDPESGELHYSYGRDASNTSFSTPQTLEIGEARETSVATDAAGIGWVIWRENSGDAIAMPVEPGEPTPPTPPSGGGGGSGSSGGSTTPPVVPAKPTPPAAPGPVATKTTSTPVVPGLNATLSTPKACVAGGATFKAKVAVKRKGSKAHKLSYSVKQVGFSVNGKLISTDTTKPFEATLHGSARAGSSIPVAAKISVLLKKGHRHSSVTKTLTATVTTCG
jgi:hypothetical protein